MIIEDKFGTRDDGSEGFLVHWYGYSGREPIEGEDVIFRYTVAPEQREKADRMAASFVDSLRSDGAISVQVVEVLTSGAA